MWGTTSLHINTVFREIHKTSLFWLDLLLKKHTSLTWKALRWIKIKLGIFGPPSKCYMCQKIAIIKHGVDQWNFVGLFLFAWFRKACKGKKWIVMCNAKFLWRSSWILSGTPLWLQFRLPTDKCLKIIIYLGMFQINPNPLGINLNWQLYFLLILWPICLKFIFSQFQMKIWKFPSIFQRNFHLQELLFMMIV